jgi:RNA polymerase sigma-70 factor (ECF subfamily)
MSVLGIGMGIIAGCGPAGARPAWRGSRIDGGRPTADREAFSAGSAAARPVAAAPTAEERDRARRAAIEHLDAVYNLARWLLRNDHDAEDAAQEACLRALRTASAVRSGDPRAWMLSIVRNICYDRIQKRRPGPGDPEPVIALAAGREPAPDRGLSADARGDAVARALEGLPEEFREAVVLRELEGLTYKQIAEVTGAAMGTVMSRLSRAREMLRQRLAGEQEGGHGL